MKILRKPSYLGLSAQVAEIAACADASRSHAERTRAARVAVGRALLGQRVGLVRIGGKDHLVPEADADRLPGNLRPRAWGVLRACDERGVVAIE